MSNVTHCSHGKAYKGEDCPECEAVWDEMMKSPKHRQMEEEIATLRAKLEAKDKALGLAKDALEAVRCSTVYAHEDDEAGDHGCCGERSYEPHATDCWTHLRTKALLAIKEATK